MGWPASLGVGILTAAVATVLAGFVANLSVGWYRISSFEGKAGYYVVLMALAGLVAGLVIGVVASRMVAASAHPGFLRALGLAQGVTLGLIAVIGGAARLLADVPPRLQGEELLLAVEIRWPAGRGPADAADSAQWWLRLGSSSGRTMRASQNGPLWREDAREEEGHWIVPGAVNLFTARGDRVIDVLPEGIIEHGFQVPLPGRPGPQYLEWSEWLPRAREGDPPLPDGFRYRFRVVPTSQPVRTERVGPFEVVTIASGFGEATYGSNPTIWISDAEFEVRHRGRAVTFEEPSEAGDSVRRLERVEVVAAIGGPRPALLVQASARSESAPCHLVTEGDSALAVTTVPRCGSLRYATPLTGDPDAFAAARSRTVPEGRLDRVTFAVPGLYHLQGLVVDTRTLAMRPYQAEGQHRLIDRIPPLAASPDGDSFVRLEWGEDSTDELALAVTRLATGERYRVPVDPSRMRYQDIDQIDPAWVDHHFAWRRDAAGVERLEERAGFAPLPWRGALTLDRTGYREYRVAPARAGLRPALIDFLVAEFQAERLPAEESDFSQRVRIGSDTVSVSFREEDAHVGVWMDRGTDSRLVVTIAERFDAALATRRYDHLMGR